MDIKNQKPETPEHKAQKRLTYGRALNISIEFAFIIVVPLLAFVFLGKFLDQRYNSHFFVPLGIILALASSTIWFVKVIKKLAKEIKDI